MSGQKPTIWTGMALGLMSAVLTAVAVAIVILVGAPIEVAAVIGAIISISVYSYLQSRK